MKKKLKTPRRQLDYKKNYEKEHYVQKLIKFKKEDYEIIDNILKDKEITFTQYIMEKIEEDLRGIK